MAGCEWMNELLIGWVSGPMGWWLVGRFYRCMG